MAITLTPIDKSSEISFTPIEEPTGAQDIVQGTGFGPWLWLTYAETVSGSGALQVDLIGKS